ncbi:hypothetical protein RFI_16806 [Reticulomyxa filosa]|uniref:Uncharacterized protein n=1 Tax=Reticulomyxa filosa TaxID=46433 RepID=X6N2Z0_RETFI|nr:hypothetical protein RFI_16806 [Reticulomyxa filosa]|eukprot:ETO20416.1 hypothetical protein RFI_16806 [Reticulomyxa filosa]
MQRVFGKINLFSALLCSGYSTFFPKFMLFLTFISKCFLLLSAQCTSNEQREAVLKVIGISKPFNDNDGNSDSDNDNDNNNNSNANAHTNANINTNEKISDRKNGGNEGSQTKPDNVNRKTSYILNKPQSKEFTIIGSVPRPHPDSPATPNRMYVKISDYGFQNHLNFDQNVNLLIFSKKITLKFNTHNYTFFFLIRNEMNDQLLGRLSN